MLCEGVNWDVASVDKGLVCILCMAFMHQWLQNKVPRYLKPNAFKISLSERRQEVEKLEFINSMDQKQDTLVSITAQGGLRLWSICPIRGVMCVFQSVSTGLSQEYLRTFTQLQRSILQHASFIGFVAGGQVTLKKVLAVPDRPQFIHVAGFMFGNVIQESFGHIAWDPTGSFLAACTVSGSLRVYFDHGDQHEVVEAVTNAEQAAFMPGDPTLLFCITSGEAIMLNLRACPECSAFCQAVDTFCRLSSGSSATARTTAGKKDEDLSHDPIARSWLPGPCNHQPAQLPETTFSEDALHASVLPAIDAAPTLGIRHDMQPSDASSSQSSQIHDVHATHHPTPHCTHTVSEPEGLSCTSTHGSQGHTQPHTESKTGIAQRQAQSDPVAADSADVQRTYSRRKRARAASSLPESCTSNSHEAGYAWLQGADETPGSNTYRGYGQNSLLCSHVNTDQTGAQASAEADVTECENASDMGAVAVRFTSMPATTAFDPKTGRYNYPFHAHRDTVTQVLPLQNGLHILTSSLDNTHKLWTLEGRGLCTLSPPMEMISWTSSLPALSSCERFVMAGHCDSLLVWEISKVLEDAGKLPDKFRDGNDQQELNDHQCMVTAVATSSCGTMMASADTSGRIVIRFSCTE